MGVGSRDRTNSFRIFEYSNFPERRDRRYIEVVVRKDGWLTYGF
ncbi:hypothetical protein LEP1GSC060_1335 [Leptospira weilii serovar Ranarum str. ICFT]|uniref:Uncharacterized protein n=1 Tax=Leptospira weilii serovar Ranarum str. ICFT TaxID=1218598 RepID=N1WGT5_9LEPT|nr:hypothetical protein LEP1GSC060_1335 [Leptospira weilii serovar Ranarum str. ICFT]